MVKRCISDFIWNQAVFPHFWNPSEEKQDYQKKTNKPQALPKHLANASAKARTCKVSYMQHVC